VAQAVKMGGEDTTKHKVALLMTTMVVTMVGALALLTTAMKEVAVVMAQYGSSGTA